ncbi:MAG: hypothetical protein SF182_05645 [Deltaproteobacteria bacterium]|nr:hypothetical protein [Deltaproteobacteria bacterium]
MAGEQQTTRGADAWDASGAGEPAIRRDAHGVARLDDFYTPLDVALRELRRRRTDPHLAAELAAFHRRHPPDFLPAAPCLILVRAVASPDFELGEFARQAAASGVAPLCLELRRDRFVSFNRDKYCRGKLTFRWGTHLRGLRAVDFHRHDGRRFEQIPTVAGEPLREFHHALLAAAYPALLAHTRDGSLWLHAARVDAPPYLPLLGLAIRDGILMENFSVNDAEERRLTETRVLPAFAALQARFGLRPLVAPVVPPAREDEAHWWHYPGGLFRLAQQRLRRGARLIQ